MVLKLLEGQPYIQKSYTELITQLVLNREALTQATWNNGLKTGVHFIAAVITGTPLNDPEALTFLGWRDDQVGPVPLAATQKRQDNIYRFSKNGKKVDIRIGSVHSVKGENHTATLVLETYWKDRKGKHNLELLLPWLKGESSAAKSLGKEQKERLKIHYVAMTRPSHLLCLAMKKTSFQNEAVDLDQDWHGWKIKLI